ncbi:MAG: hypothetical protein QXI71_03135 [Candidatus Bathyarchaeia archaeon]
MQIKRIILAIFGLITTIVGWGMWKAPHIDFDTLISLIAEEIVRLVNDPFAILGLIVLLLGLWVFFKAILETEDVKNILSFGKNQDEF